MVDRHMHVTYLNETSEVLLNDYMCSFPGVHNGSCEWGSHVLVWAGGIWSGRQLDIGWWDRLRNSTKVSKRWILLKEKGKKERVVWCTYCMCHGWGLSIKLYDRFISSSLCLMRVILCSSDVDYLIANCSTLFFNTSSLKSFQIWPSRHNSTIVLRVPSNMTGKKPVIFP